MFTPRWQWQNKQECIPVGCVPPGAVAVLRGSPPGTPHTPTPHPPGAGTPGTRHPPGPGTPQDQTPPPVNRMTDRCKNITLPQTSFAGGNKFFCVIAIAVMNGFNTHNGNGNNKNGYHDDQLECSHWVRVKV